MSKQNIFYPFIIIKKNYILCYVMCVCVKEKRVSKTNIDSNK